MQSNPDEKAFTVYASFPISVGFPLSSTPHMHKQIQKLNPSLQPFSQGKVSPLPSFTFRLCAHKMAAAACGWAWKAQEAAFLFPTLPAQEALLLLFSVAFCSCIALCKSKGVSNV